MDFSGVVGGETAYAVDETPVSEIAGDGRYNLGLVDLGDTRNFEEISTSAFTGTLSLHFDIQTADEESDSRSKGTVPIGAALFL